MRVRLLTAMAGHNWSASPGDLIDVRPDEGQRLIASGQAEAATVAPTENAAKRPPEPRRRKETRG